MRKRTLVPSIAAILIVLIWVTTFQLTGAPDNGEFDETIGEGNRDLEVVSGSRAHVAESVRFLVDDVGDDNSAILVDKDRVLSGVFVTRSGQPIVGGRVGAIDVTYNKRKEVCVDTSVGGQFLLRLPRSHFSGGMARVVATGQTAGMFDGFVPIREGVRLVVAVDESDLSWGFSGTVDLVSDPGCDWMVKVISRDPGQLMPRFIATTHYPLHAGARAFVQLRYADISQITWGGGVSLVVAAPPRFNVIASANFNSVGALQEALALGLTLKRIDLRLTVPAVDGEDPSDVVLIPRETGFGMIAARRDVAHWRVMASPGNYIMRAVVSARKLGEAFVTVGVNSDIVVHEWDAVLPGPRSVEIFMDQDIENTEVSVSTIIERMFDGVYIPSYRARVSHDGSQIRIDGLEQGLHRIQVSAASFGRRVEIVNVPCDPIDLRGVGGMCDVAIEIDDKLDAFETLPIDGVEIGWRVRPDGEWVTRTIGFRSSSGLRALGLPFKKDVQVYIHGLLDPDTRWCGHGELRTPASSSATLLVNGAVAAALDGVVQNLDAVADRPATAILDYGDAVRLGESSTIAKSGEFRVWVRVGTAAPTLRIVSSDNQELWSGVVEDGHENPMVVRLAGR